MDKIIKCFPAYVDYPTKYIVKYNLSQDRLITITRQIIRARFVHHLRSRMEESLATLIKFNENLFYEPDIKFALMADNVVVFSKWLLEQLSTSKGAAIGFNLSDVEYCHQFSRYKWLMLAACLGAAKCFAAIIATYINKYLISVEHKKKYWLMA